MNDFFSRKLLGGETTHSTMGVECMQQLLFWHSDRSIVPFRNDLSSNKFIPRTVLGNGPRALFETGAHIFYSRPTNERATQWWRQWLEPGEQINTRRASVCVGHFKTESERESPIGEATKEGRLLSSRGYNKSI